MTFYRPFSYLGLHEALRLYRDAKEKTTPKKIDSQVIFDFFESKSILNVCGFTLKMYESLIKTWADKNLDEEADEDDNKIENADYRRIKSLLLFKTGYEL